MRRLTFPVIAAVRSTHR